MRTYVHIYAVRNFQEYAGDGKIRRYERPGYLCCYKFKGQDPITRFIKKAQNIHDAVFYTIMCAVMDAAASGCRFSEITVYRSQSSIHRECRVPLTGRRGVVLRGLSTLSRKYLHTARHVARVKSISLKNIRRKGQNPARDFLEKTCFERLLLESGLKSRALAKVLGVKVREAAILCQAPHFANADQVRILKEFIESKKE